MWLGVYTGIEAKSRSMYLKFAKNLDYRVVIESG